MRLEVIEYAAKKRAYRIVQSKEEDGWDKFSGSRSRHKG